MGGGLEGGVTSWSDIFTTDSAYKFYTGCKTCYKATHTKQSYRREGIFDTFT